MENANFYVPPQQALKEGRYLWADRKTRSDVTDSRVTDLARRYWHSYDVSRASGDSGELMLFLVLVMIALLTYLLLPSLLL